MNQSFVQISCAKLCFAIPSVCKGQETLFLNFVDIAFPCKAKGFGKLRCFARNYRAYPFLSTLLITGFILVGKKLIERHMVHFSGVLRFAHPFGFATTCEAQERHVLRRSFARRTQLQLRSYIFLVQSVAL